MLGIGFKVSDAPPASIQRPLRDFLSTRFATTATSTPPSGASEISGASGASGASGESGEALDPHAPLQRALDQFSQLRADATLVRAPSPMAAHVLLRYYAQLDRMAARFDATVAASSALSVPFTWNDSFCPRKKTTASTAPLRFEMAAVLFNYGALESQLGVQTDRSDADGLKTACRHFMRAAGAFATVRDALVPKFLIGGGSAASPDMSHEGLSMLTALMLAQAQACFYEKAIKDQMKDAVKAKLVHQALEYYATALEACGSPALHNVIDRMWSVHVQFQVICMKAATQFWQAKACKDVALQRGVGYGEEIARLQAADADCSDALKMGNQNKLPTALVMSARALQRVVEDTLASAKKDNASIYLDKVPSRNELGPVGKASMVRPLALTDDELIAELSASGGDLFTAFVPHALLQQAATAKDAVATLLATAKARVAASTDRVKETLHDMGLPAAIEAFEPTADNGIPAAVWSKIQHIQKEHANATNAMQQQLEANDAASDRAEKQLRAVETKLSSEEVEDNVCRQNYGTTRWRRPASATLNDGFRLDIDRYYRLVKEAKASDKVVATKLGETHALLLLLTQSKPQLDAQLPPLASDTSSCRDEIASVAHLLLQLTALVDETDHVLQDFAASVEKFNVLPILLGGTDDVDAALANETKFFETHFVAKLDAIDRDATTTLEALAVANATFEAKKVSDHVLLARQAFLQQLSDAIETYDQLQSHLKEGGAFYDELATRIAQLQQTVDDHCAARDLERRELELHVHADDSQRQREAHDAAVAAQMMRDMQLRDESTDATARDEAMARQLAGGVPQQFQPSTPSAAPATATMSASGLYGAFSPSSQSQPPPYDFSRLPQQHQQQHHPYASYQHQATSSTTNSNASAPPPAYSSIFSSSPSSTPQFGNYYYDQQQQHQQQHQRNPSNSYYQYPGATSYPQNSQSPSDNYTLFPRPPGNGSV